MYSFPLQKYIMVNNHFISGHFYKAIILGYNFYVTLLTIFSSSSAAIKVNILQGMHLMKFLVHVKGYAIINTLSLKWRHKILYTAAG